MADHSVAADLSGDVALTSDLTGAVSITSALSGDVALASELDQDFVVTLGLSGDVVLTSGLTGAVPIAADLSGDAAFTATDATTVPITADLSGDASLTGELDQDFVVTSALSGDAALVSDLTGAVPIASALAGDAAMTSNLTGAVPLAASLSGDAAFVATDVTTVSVTADLSGDAALVGELDQDFVVVLVLAGDAALVGELDQDFVVASALSGAASLSATDTTAVPITATLQGEAVLAGELDQDFLVVAALTGEAALVSTTAGAVPVEASLSGAAALSGDLSGVVPITTTLSGEAALEAILTGALPVVASLSGEATLAGELDQNFVVSSELSGTADLSALALADVVVASALSGSADVSSDSSVSFVIASALSGESVLSATDVTSVPVNATFSGEASLDAGLISAVPVEAVLSGDASLTGTDATTVSVDITLSGTADLVSVLSGSVAASASLSGDGSFEPRLLRIAPVFSRHNVVFGGTDEYITMGDVLDKNKVDPFSISCWFKTSLTSIQYLVSKFDAAPKGWGLRTNNGTLEMLLFNSGAYEVAVKTTAATFADGLWHHVVATIDGSGLASGVRLYVDNVDEPRTIVLDTLGAYDFNNLGSLNVGARTNGAVALLTGSVDDVSIWDVVLNAEAVSRVYDGGYPGDLEHHPQAADIAGWWLMGDGDTYPIILDHSTPKQRFPIVSDQGPSGYDGTATNMELADVQADVPGAYAAVFGGSTEYVRVPHNVAFSFEYNQPFSISAWVRADPSYASNRFFVTKTNTTRGWWLGTYSSGALWFQIAYDGSNYVRAAASINVCDGAWHYIVGTYDGSGTAAGMQVYVDGQLATTSQSGNPLALTIATTSDVNFSGANNTNWRGGQKDISDVAIWSKTLSASEVSELYNDKRPVDHTIVASNLVGWWRIGTRFSTVSNGIIDFSGNERHGSAISMVSTNFVRRDYGDTLSKSLLFGGTDEYVTMGNVLGFERTDAFSISLWFKSTVSGVFLSKYSSIFRGFATYVIGTGLIDFALVSDASQRAIIRTTTAWHDGNWHHVAVVSTGTSTVAGMKIYVDGVVQTTTTIDDDLAATIVSTSNLWLGGRDVPGDEFCLVGSLDDVSVWDKALSQAEVTAVYNFGIPTDLSGSSNLVGYWPLGEAASNHYDATMVNMEAEDIVEDAPGLLTFEGVAVLTASGSLLFSVGASLSGSADFEASFEANVQVQADLSGEAILTAMDATSVPIEASLSGDATLTSGAGVPRYSIESVTFDGVNEYVDAGTVLNFDTSDKFSFSAWVYITDTNSGTIIAKQASGTPFGWTLFVGLSGGLFRFRVELVNYGPSAAARAQTSRSVAPNEWHHVVATWDGNETPGAAGISFYVDGVADVGVPYQDNLGTATIANASARVGIGARVYPTDPVYYAGRIDELSVWNKELTVSEAEEIWNGGHPADLQSHSAVANLVAWWRMGEYSTYPSILDGRLGAAPSTTFPSILDLSSNGFHGTMTNMATNDIVLDSPGGNFSKMSLDFDGSNDFVNMGNVLNFERTDPVTFSFRVKTTAISDHFLSKMDATVNFRGYTIYMTAAGRVNVFFINVDATSKIKVLSAGSVNNGVWRHVVVTYDGSSTAAGVTITIDNVPQAITVEQDNLSGTIITAQSFNVSGRTNGTACLLGKIDDVCVYSAVLTPAERTELFNGGVPTDNRLLSSAPILVGYWRMGDDVRFDGTMVNMESGDITDDTPWIHLAGVELSGDATLGADLDQGFVVASTLMGDAALTADARVPRYSIESVTFDGVDEYVTMGNVLGFERTEAFSISFWFKTVSGTAMSAISKMTGSDYRGYDVAFTNGTTIHFQLISTVSGNNAVRLDTPFLYNDGLWHHYVGTYDGSSSVFGVTAYVDGIPIASAAGLNNLTSTILNTASLQLGIRSGVALPAPFNGSLDEVSIWNKKLSASEASEVYNGGRPANLALHSAVTSLVGWWRMGEYATFPIIPGMVAGSNPYPTILDSTGHGYDGTMVGMSSASIQTVAPYGKCLTFDGVDEYIKMGNVLGFESTDAFSLSCWYKGTGIGTSQHILSKRDNTSDFRGYNVSTLATGVLSFSLVNSSAGPLVAISVETTVPVNTGVWKHIVVTYDGLGLASGAAIYLDGQPVTLSVALDTLGTNTLINSAEFNVSGRTNGVIGLLAGSVSDVTVWNKELSAAEAASLYNDGQLPVDMLSTGMVANLVGWWPLGEGDVHPTVYDRSVSGHNGTMVNMETSDFGDHDLNALALSQKSLYFSNQYVSIGNVLNYERTDSFSFTAWFRNTATGVQMIFGKVGPENYRGYSVYTQSGNIVVEIIGSWSGNWIQVSTTGLAVTSSGWHHVAVTYNGSSAAAGVLIYVDGRQAPTNVGSNSLSTTIVTTADLRIGSRQTGALPFYGDIDEVAFYSKMLSQAEVTAIYNLGVPTNLLALSSATDIDAWWRMGDDAPPDDGTMVNMEAGDFTSDTPWTHLVEAALSGEASLNADVSGAVLVEVGLSGDSALTGAVLRALSAEAGLSGDAALTADVTVDTITLDLSGEAALSAALSAAVPVQSGLSGDAVLTADVTVVAMVEAPLSGEATLEASLLAVVPLASDLSGEAALSATLTYLSLTLLETVGLSETSVVGQTHQATSAMSGDAAFEADVQIEAAVEAYLGGDAAFTATVVQDLEAALSGDASVLADILALVLVDAAFSGTATVEADATADVLLMTDFLGEAALFGEVGVHADLVSAMQGEASLGGRLSIGRSGIVSDATIIPKRSPQESAYQTKHYSIQDRRR